jgi:hypothetical protein
MSDRKTFNFVVESDASEDALARLLDLFSTDRAILQGVEHRRDAASARTVFTAVELDPSLAQALSRRLEALPFVRTVGFGWRAAPITS